MSTIINLHAIQAVPASLLNRDDTNSAKTITFGGVARTRVSSQSFKRAIRNLMREEAVAGGAFSFRSNRWPARIVDVLVSDHDLAFERAQALTASAFASAGFELNEDKGITKVSIFARENLAEQVAAAIAAHEDEFVEKTVAKAAKKPARGKARTAEETPSDEPEEELKLIAPEAVVKAFHTALSVDDAVDLAAFGRMLATKEKLDLRVDGAVAVDHAMSVEAAAVVDDFYTAVDDLSVGEEAASNNLGVVDLTAPVFYRTLAIDVDQLRSNLASAADPDALTATAIRSIIGAFVRAVPSAKKNSTNVGTLPSLIVGTVGTKRLTAHNAFTVPITGDTVIADATDALLRTLQTQRRLTAAQKTVLLSGDPTADAALDSAADAIDAINATVAADLDEFTAEVAA
ncbi:hypothetical protein ACT17_05990 [Mycolicibacterium conceptionense]|uniref:Type I-E CRISPR-associated protein Cas7/Cse4/CasC n=1 Tax=Mycolicibacterium conceptionense TaxID=451644 RepID=A0A0J8X2B4_9MYCO|nr:type I-E CRISPR-associated protein Cas7/Cse4/CasC [Mycolicibacterium conceptionense]KMV19599.1 hypothetical protein ACT17_05990 [Mycolicibacterium conceptionense]